MILVDFCRENQNMSLKEMEYSTFFLSQTEYST